MKWINVVVPLVLVACSQVEPENFDKYTKNPAGVKVLVSYIKDTNNTAENRVKAALTVLGTGWADKATEIIDGCADRDVFAGKFMDGLLTSLETAGDDIEKAAPFRDAFFATITFVPEKEQAAMQERMAKWIFRDLSLESSADDVKGRIEPRLVMTEIVKLGAPGAGMATVLVRHGFEADRVADYILNTKDKAAQLQLLDAYIAFHKTPDLVIPFTNLEAIGRIKDARAAVYLLDLANNPDMEADIKSAAFNEAAGLMEDPSILAGNRDLLIKRLGTMMDSKSADDRWSAANFLVLIQGAEAFPKIMDGFQDDGVYPNAEEDPMKSIVDFCKMTVWKKGKEAENWPLIEKMVKSKNYVHKTIGTICVKASRDISKASLLERHLGDRTNVDPILGEKVTLGALAQNAMDGLKMFEEVDKDIEAGRMTAPDADHLRFLIMVNLWSSGQAYRKSVAERFKEERAEATR